MRPDPTRCLLLIDDEPAQRRLVSAIGSRAGWWVRGAPDVETAQKMLCDPQEPNLQKRVMRGGSYLCNEAYCSGYRPSARMKSSPDTGLSHTGFRCVSTTEPK